MALFQPSFVTPDVRGGLGNGVVDADGPFFVEWQVNGNSGLTRYQIDFFRNDTESTYLFSVAGSMAQPFYGTTPDGERARVSVRVPRGGELANGNRYKLKITQFWEENGAEQSVAQVSASVFDTRGAPSLSIVGMGSATAMTIGSRAYSFTGQYSQPQGDTLNWYRWRIARAGNLDAPVLDTGNVYGTMDIRTNYDGFFTGVNYAIRLTAQTQNGVELDTGWRGVFVAYETPQPSGRVAAECVPGTGAVRVGWGNAGEIPAQWTGTAGDGYEIVDRGGALAPALRVAGGVPYWICAQFDEPVEPTWTAEWFYSMDAEQLAWHRTIEAMYPGGLNHPDERYARQMFSMSEVNFGVGVCDLWLSTTLGTVAAFGGANTPILDAPFSIALASWNIAAATALTIHGRLTKDAVIIKPTWTIGGAAYTAQFSRTFRSSIHYTAAQFTVNDVYAGADFDIRYIEVVSGDRGSAALNDGYEPALTPGTMFLTDFRSGAYATNYEIGLTPRDISGWAVYRRTQEEGSDLAHVADVGAGAGAVYDYAARSNQGPYAYYAFPIDANGDAAAPAAVSNQVSPVFADWTLLECEKTGKDAFSVLAEYRFRYNLTTGDMGNNNTPTVEANFTRYPTVLRSAQNYRSGSLTALVGAVDASDGMRYLDTLAIRDRLFALSTTEHALFLKSRKGDLIRVRLSEPVTVRTMDKTFAQAQTATLTWVEVGSAERVSLTAAQNMAAGLGELLNPNLTLTMQ